jgi:RNA polymerase sporulation-specific sigma factor
MHYVMNDYELIYLIHTEHDEVALSFMFSKYHKFIWKQVHLLNVATKEHDDLHQEGSLMLLKAIQTFNEAKNKSFTRYFELILKRKLYHLIDKIPKYQLYEDTNFCKGVSYIEEEPIEFDLTSKLEQDIYQLYFIDGVSITEIQKTTEFTKKQIYNSIYRIKEKYKMMV